jgi:hypothetical protein
MKVRVSPGSRIPRGHMSLWGRSFANPARIKRSDIDIYAIAQSLSNQCRFNGHCEFYSVADHSVRVSDCCSNAEVALWGLLHDASEAYLHDIIWPLKQRPQFSFYRRWERIAMSAVSSHFGLFPKQMPVEVDWWDDVLLVTEMRDLLGVECRKPPHGPRGLSAQIKPLSQKAARNLFLSRFRELCAETGREGWL